MKCWKTSALGEVVSIVGGGTPTRSNPDFYGGSIPWVTPKDMKSWEITGAQIALTQAGVDNSSTRVVPPNSILIVVRSGVLKHTVPVGLNRVPVAINQDMKALQCHDQVDADFLARFIKAQSHVILKWVRATTADNFPIDKLKKLPVPLPPLAEQRRIAEVLDKAEALRAKRRAALAQLDSLTQSLFLDLFGDPAKNPKGFKIGRIGDLLESASYGTSEKSGPHGEYAVLRMNNITRSGEMDFADLKFMDLEDGQHDRYLARDGDVLFNRTNSAELVGKTGIIRGTKPMAYAGYLIRLRVNAANDPEFLWGFLNSKYSKLMLRGMCKSIIGMANINATEIQAMKIPLPPLDLQHEFARRVAAVEKLKTAQRAALAELDALFASLQHRAFRGEL